MRRTEVSVDRITREGVPSVCAHCGSALPDRPLLREGRVYCCERCLLDGQGASAEPGLQDGLYAGLAEALTEALDQREHQTGLHSKRVACHTQVLARRFIDEPTRLRQIYWGALLHDVGKIGIPDRILLKPGPLTASEWCLMRTHPERGEKIIARLPGMAEAAAIVRSHEEHFDGSGYPDGLAGEAIPFGARLFAVIDTLDAMTSDRPYRQGLPFDAAKAEIQSQAGRQFDPLAVEAFLVEEPTLREMVALRPCHRRRHRALRHPGREDRLVLHHADGRAHTRHRPQAGAGDAAHRRSDRCADGDG